MGQQVDWGNQVIGRYAPEAAAHDMRARPGCSILKYPRFVVPDYAERMRKRMKVHQIAPDSVAQQPVRRQGGMELLFPGLATASVSVKGRLRPLLLPSLLVLTHALVSTANLPRLHADEPPVDFGREIRPILSDQCFLCHGPAEETREADLRLDRREAAIEAGALQPGAVARSELIARITAADPEQRMPPPSSGKRLSDRQIDLLRRWVAEGANYEEHWAFAKPTRPPVPAAANAIDHFVARKLKPLGLEPAEPADRVSLARRLYLDLIGLPPSPQQVERYVKDVRRDATQRLIDELLESPHFGERWARWWLDAARYADSDGYEKDKPRSVWFYRDWVIRSMNDDKPYDQFVVEQIAGDLLPDAGQDERVATGFLRNSMVNEEGGADPEQFRVEGMFDRIDAIGKAILGVTTQCAQCHTHKYDPLSQHEYYQMFAALNDFHEATISVFTPEQQKQVKDIEEAVARIRERIQSDVPDWEQQLHQWARQAANQLPSWRTLVPTDLPFEGQKFRVLDDGSIVSESYAPTRANNTFSLAIQPQTIQAFRLDALQHPQLPRGGPGRSIHGTGALSEIEVTLTPLGEGGKPTKVKFAQALSDVNAPRTRLLPIYRDKNPDKDQRVTGPAEYAIDGDRATAWTTDAGPKFRNQDHCLILIPEAPVVVEQPSTISITLRQLHGGWNSDDNQNYLLGRYRFSVTTGECTSQQLLAPGIEQILRRSEKELSAEDRLRLFDQWRQSVESLAPFNQRIAQLWSGYPESDSQLVVQTREVPRESFVFARGDFLNPTDSVSPGVPEFLNDLPPSSEPPRLRFARWLVADDSPTAARVVVNRIWQAYFGRGLVETPEDFGYQSSPPSHPELLDWLAVELMENQWSLKHVHRLIVTSQTYQQSSVVTKQVRELDPDNRWLSRGPRLRVEAEIVRDIALTISGLLVPEIGGPSVYPPAPDFLFQPPASYGPKTWPTSQGRDPFRRSLYVHRYRSVPFPALQVFDAPKGDAACVRRPLSNTPLQALVVLNEPQFFQCAQAMARRVVGEGGDSDESRLEYAFRLAVSRRPDSGDREILNRLLSEQRQRLSRGELDVASLVGKVSLPGYPDAVTDEQLAPWVVVCRVLLNLDETLTKP